MRRMVIATALLVSACGGSVEKTEPCPPDQLNDSKAWFVGDLLEEGDEPPLTLEITVTDAIFDGPPVDSSFVGASVSTTVTAQITADVLLLRGADGSVRSAFEIWRHSMTACGQGTPQYEGEEPYPVWDEWAPPQWFDRPWFRVEWGEDVAGREHYAFDEAAAAGYPDAVEYHPLAYHVSGVRAHVADDQIAFTAKAYVTFNPIDDDTPGCVFDLPDALGCPVGELTLSYVLTR